MVGIIKVYKDSTSICVYWKGSESLHVGSLESSLMSPGLWLVNRALVNPKSMRGKGIGSAMMLKLKQSLPKSGIVLQVAPGGYEDNHEEQCRWYIKQGFKETSERGLFEWKPGG